MFKSIVYQAAQNQMRLLIQHPLYLFQIKISYYIKPDFVKLFIHIPMALVDPLPGS
jgi:hypothetical protein